MIYQAAAQAIPAVCKTAAASQTSHSILDPIAKPIADVLAFFYSLIPNYAVAILLLSLAWMLIISPLTLKTTRSMLAMQKLAPELKRLQEKHRNDRQALAQAQMDLYKEHNVSPFGSCLPTILPLPVFIALFRVIDELSATTKVHGVSCATPHFLPHTTAMYQSIQQSGGHLNAFGLDLAKSALSSHTSVATAVPFFILLLLMMATQYVQTAQMMSRNAAAQQNPQMKLMKYMPLLFGVICIRFPAGVVLYYAMSNVCRIFQQDLMYRFDPKVKALAIKDVAEIEAHAGMTDEGETEARGLFNRSRGGDGDGTSGRTRFRDLLGGELQKQAEAREQTKATKSPAPGKSGNAKSGSGSVRSATGSGPTKAGSGAAKTGSGAAKTGGRSAPAKAGSGASKSGAGRPPGSNSGRQAATSRQAAAAARSNSGQPGKAAPTKTAATTRSATGRTTPASNGGGTESPVNGQRSGNSAPASGDHGKGATPSRTGAGSGRTGAASGRTGAQGSRNKRRGR